MKQISTVNMQPENKHMLRRDVLGVFGNENIREHRRFLKCGFCPTVFTFIHSFSVVVSQPLSLVIFK